MLSVNGMNITIYHLLNREHPPWAPTIRMAKMSPPHENEEKLHLQTTIPITNLRLQNA
jgi:hypothetical protein